MRDYINGKEVHLFYKPMFNEVQKNIWYNSGTSKSYTIGDNIPSKTMYYILPKDFLILNYNVDYNKIDFHIIENHKIFKTININDIDDSFFSKYKTVFDSKGYKLNIKRKQDCIDFIYDTENKFSFEIERQKEISDIIYNILDPLYVFKGYLIDILNELTNTNNANIYPNQIRDFLNKHSDIEADIYELFNINSMDSLYEKLFKGNIENLSMAINYTSEKIELYNKKVDRLNNLSSLTTDELVSNYNLKWHKKDNFSKEKTLGELLFCFIYASVNRNDEVDDFLGDPFEKYLSIKNTLKSYLLEHPAILKSYCKWQELDSLMLEEIYSLCEFVITSKDEDYLNNLPTHLIF